MGAAKWRAKTDAIALSLLTDAAVQAWKRSRDKGAGMAPTAQHRARNTFNSTLRQATGLPSKRVLPFARESLARDGILLPDPLPLAGIKPFARQSTTYVSKIGPEALIEAYRRDLGANPARQEEWKIFLLAFTTGLRIRDIDTLLWRQVDPNRSTIRIETTEFFRPKTEDSHAQHPVARGPPGSTSVSQGPW